MKFDSRSDNCLGIIQLVKKIKGQKKILEGYKDDVTKN